MPSKTKENPTGTAKKKNVIQKTIKKYFSYSKENLKSCLEAIDGGKTIRASCKRFNIPFSTARNKVKRLFTNNKSGPGTTLTEEDELKIVAWMKGMNRTGFAVTKELLLDSVALYVKKTNIKNHFANGRPGKKWLSGFQERHPDFSLRTPQNLNYRRANITEENIRGWFLEVGEYLIEKGLLDIDPSRIFNCDESAFFLNPKGKKVFIPKKSKSAHIAVGDNDKECLTTLITGNAAGQLAPPLVMYSYKRTPTTLFDNIPKGWSAGHSENGWMTAESFYEYMTNIFYPWCTKNNIEFPIIMYMDGHSSHATLPLSLFCSEKLIELISLYPNSTHVCQPMDVAYFASLKNEWKNEVVRFRMDNDGANLTKSKFASVLKSAIEKIDSAKNLKNGFRRCGLSPFSPDAIDYTKFLSIANRPKENDDANVRIQSDDHAEAHTTLKFIERKLTLNVRQLFLLTELSGGHWEGEAGFTELFSMWYECRQTLKNESRITDEEDSIVSLAVNPTSVDNTIELSHYNVNSPQDQSEILTLELPIITQNEYIEALGIESTTNNSPDVLGNCSTSVNKESCTEVPTGVDSLEESAMLLESISNDSNSISSNGPISDTVRPSSNVSEKAEIPVEKSDLPVESTSERKSNPFDDVFKYPQSQQQRKKKQVKTSNPKLQKLPSVVTGTKWQEIKAFTLEQQRLESEEKEKRKQIRLNVAKIKKEQSAEKAKKLEETREKRRIKEEEKAKQKEELRKKKIEEKAQKKEESMSKNLKTGKCKSNEKKNSCKKKKLLKRVQRNELC